MRTARPALLAAVLAAAATLLPGCLQCGFDGAGDQMYQRGNDALMVCANGGYSAMLTTGSLEGRFALTYLDTGMRELDAFDGPTAEAAFSLNEGTDGTWSSTQLGDGWQLVTLDATDLDHAHTQCTDLETRAWW